MINHHILLATKANSTIYVTFIYVGYDSTKW